MNTPRALIATNEPEKIKEDAKRLVALGWHLIGTKNVADFFSRHGLAVKDVAEFAGVKDEYGIPPTLHPKIEQALTQDVDFSIDLVFDVPYPISEGNDIGGRTILALAVKGGRWAVSDENDLRELISSLENGCKDSSLLKKKFAAKVLFQIAAYYSQFAKGFSGEFEVFFAEAKFDCSEGENPYQNPSNFFAFYEQDQLGAGNFIRHSLAAPSFITMADMDNVVITIEKLKSAFCENFKKVPFITVAAKHGNPCGIGIDWDDSTESIKKALWGNAKAIWGGEVACNFTIDEGQARELLESHQRKDRFGLAQWMLDLVVAADFSESAKKLLADRKNRVLMSNPALREITRGSGRTLYRFVRGGYLKCPAADYVLKLQDIDWTQEVETDRGSILIAWAAAYSSFLGGNEVSLAKDGMLIGTGGSPSTVMAAGNAVSSALWSGHDTGGAFFCANAFFPFTDAPAILADAGCAAGVVPSGGKGEEEVKSFFRSRSIPCGFIPAQFRGFSRH